MATKKTIFSCVPTSAAIAERREADEPGEDHDVAPVDPVGDAPERNLEDRAADHGGRQHGGALGRREPVVLAVDRRQVAPAAGDHAGEEGADDRRRRVAEQPPETELRLRQRPRRLRVRQARRDQRQRVDDGADHEQRQVERAAERHDVLPGHQRQHGDHHVDGEHRPARLVGHLLVQPALDHHVAAGDREAGDGAEGDPRGRLYDEGVHQQRDRHQRRQHAEHAHMADAHHQLRRDDAACGEGQRIARRDQRDREGGPAFGNRPERQQVAGETAGEQHEEGGEEQAGDGQDAGQHVDS